MLGDVQKYLITAAEMKREIRRKPWMCFGMCHLANDSRSTVYCYLDFTVFVPMGLVYAWTEDFLSGCWTLDQGCLSCYWSSHTSPGMCSCCPVSSGAPFGWAERSLSDQQSRGQRSRVRVTGITPLVRLWHREWSGISPQRHSRGRTFHSVAKDSRSKRWETGWVSTSDGCCGRGPDNWVSQLGFRV